MVKLNVDEISKMMEKKRKIRKMYVIENVDNGKQKMKE